MVLIVVMIYNCVRKVGKIMKTDLEKTEKMLNMLGLNIAKHIRETKIDIAIYDGDIYLRSVYFNLDGSFMTWD